MPGLLDAPPTALPPAADPGGPLTHDSPLVRAWAERLGGIPAARIVLDPAPGTATEADWERVRRHGKLCELIDGVLVEKAVSYFSSVVGAEILRLLGNYLEANPAPTASGSGSSRGSRGSCGCRSGAGAYPGAGPGRAIRPPRPFPRRSPPPHRLPDPRPELGGGSPLPPQYPGEIALKLRRLFAAGTTRAWVVDPLAETADVYHAADAPVPVPAGGALDAAPALPGFAVNLRELFAAADA